ncbi:MAG: HD domain-containing protein [Christensenella sp.]|uniref:HD-GYP domain-containing protein n=1 Tax=Christensenella sp. TaxID=1935934 RepID=UPI002B1F1662|nr:HD domain-containing phosphohydrolase [Christensenella sp.]MEA5003228.1 HD domain-containing protein [Christensenella sp.]
MPIIDDNNISDLLQRTLNCVDPRLVDHGKRVAFIVSKMLQTQNKYTLKEQQQICFLALLHDIGAYKTEEIDQMVRFETEDIWDHAVYGYLFIRYLSPLGAYAPAILLHHLNYDRMELVKTLDVSSLHKEIAQILFLADRVDIFRETYGNKKDELNSYLERSKDKRFSSEAVELFFHAEEKHHIMEGLDVPVDFQEMIGEIAFTREEVRMYIDMIVFTIDFRSEYTVTHTITTTQIAYEAARMMGLSEKAMHKIYYGAMLHDLGKIGIPVEILEFPGKLSAQAMRVMQTHVDITAEILGNSFDHEVMRIAVRHHEKIDGSGYPNGLNAKELSISERIVAVADIVSALNGVRSYKDAFPKEKTLSIIGKMSENGQLDTQAVDMITAHFDEIMETVRERCKPVLETYDKLQAEYKTLMKQCKEAL